MRHVLGFAVGFSAALAAAGADTQSPTAVVDAPPVAEYDRFTLRAGAFLLSNINVTLRLDSLNTGEGDEVELVEDLGAKDSLSLARVDGEWRFAERHRVGFSWFDIGQTVTHELEGEIEWGDETFPIDSVVETDFGTTVVRLNYGYGLFVRDDHEVFVTIGAHVTRLEAGISAPDLGRAERVGVTAPLPVVGLEWRYRISERWRTQVSYEYFGVSLNDRFRGSLSDFLAFVDCQLSSHWSLGAGYNRYVLRATLEGNNLKLTAKHSYDGLMTYLTARF